MLYTRNLDFIQDLSEVYSSFRQDFNNHREEYKKFLTEKFQELGIGKYEKIWLIFLTC